MLRKFLAVFLFIFSFLFLAPYASASTLYLSPGSTEIPQGSIVPITIRLNTKGESVNGVSAYLLYPADKIEVAWINYGGSFPIAAEGTYGGGGIRISRGSIPGVVGNVTFATVGFKGKTQGTATVNFIGGSAAPRTSDSSDSLDLGRSTGGTFKVVAATKTVQTGTVKLINNVNISLISTNSATISWTTNNNSNSEVEYGLSSDKYFLSIRDETATKSHVLKIEGPALTPGTLFHFRVKSKDSAGNEEISGDKSFQLKGYTVTLKILDINNKPIQNTQVFLDNESKKSQTSLNGEVSFVDITPGRHLAVVKINNILDKTKEINLQDSPFSQNFTFTVNTNTELNGINYLYLAIAAIALISITALIIIIIVILKRKQKAPITNLGQTTHVAGL
jgi:hypothetical protein